MDRELLEQLEVPQPPYRMARPTVMLAAEPPVPVPEPLPAAAPEKPDPAPELLEPVGEAAIESAGAQEKERITAAPPLEGATAQESAQDASNRERAALEVDVAVAEEAAEVRAKASEGKDAEDMTTQERDANQALAARLRAERDQRQAAEAAERERQAAAKLEEGIDFPQKEETLNEKVSRLSQESLQALNDFKEAGERKAKPEEIDFAKQRVQIVQRKLEAAKLGEPIPEEHPTVATPTRPPAAPAPGPSASAPAVGDKAPYGEVIAVSPEGKPKIRYEAPVVTPPLSEGELRQKKFAEKSATEKKKQVTRDQTAALEEEVVRGGDAEVEVDKLRPAEEPVRPEEVGRQQEPSTGLEEAFDAEGNLRLVPLQERPAADKVTEVRPGTEAGDAVAKAREEAEQVLDERGRERAEGEGMGTARREASEAKKSEPTAQEKLIAQLQERIAQLEGKASSPQSEAEGERGREEEPKGPGEGERMLSELGIEDMGDTQEPGWWERQGISLEATAHDLGSYWWNIWAKRAKDSLKQRDGKIKELEKKSKALAEKSWVGTAVNPFTYGSRIVWQKWRKGLLEAAQARHDARRVEHENYRNELLNGLAQRYDTALLTYHERANEHVKDSAAMDEDLEASDATLRELALQIAQERDPKLRAGLIADRDDLREFYDQKARSRLEADAGWSENLKQAERIQSLKNQILKYANLPTSSTQPEGRERLKTRQKRQPNQPKPVAA